MDRVNKLLGQLEPQAAPMRHEHVSGFSNRRADDIVIVSCKRTPLCRARRGGFRETLAVDLLTPVLKEVTKDIDSSLVDEICVGTVLAVGTFRHMECRQAAILAGMPATTTLRTVNRQCSSGLQAIADVASDIKAGYYDVGIAAGLETMTMDGKYFNGKVQPKISTSIQTNPVAMATLLPMGITSENVAKKFGVTRQEQDELACLSHQRAAAAKQKFQSEIVPVKVTVRDAKTNKKTQVVVRHDDGVRPQTTMQTLGKLRAVFKKGGSTTAGNASQVTDGASACLMMKRSKAQELGLKPIATFTNFAVAGVPPEIMGIGPAFAIPKVLKQANLNMRDIDLFEINEAFASQAVYCVKELGLTMDNVNVNGGAIALGHPLGATGCRMAATLLAEMQRRNAKRGIVSMCIGTGMGAAGIFELE